MGSLKLSLLAHAVFASACAPDLTDLAILPHAPVTLVESNGLSLLASRLPAARAEALFAEPDAAAELALAHHRLLTTLALRRDLAPVRLGAVYSDEAAARAMLDADQERFRAALARVAGASEYALKLTPVLVSQAAEDAPVPASGRAFLQHRGALAAARRNAGEASRAAVHAAFDCLSRYARAHVFQPPRRHAAADQEKRLLDAALLVARSETERFGLAVVAAQEQADRAGYALSVAGP
ncbi:MAG: GvpL/GvpF family gas vesicle protein, partial [Beijerinckiaceae bacterium]